jgi:hypothetical protein
MISFSLQRDSPSLADRVEARFGYRNPHVHIKIAFATIPAIEYRPATGRHLTRIKVNAVRTLPTMSSWSRRIQDKIPP